MKKEKIYVCKKRKIFSRLLLSGGGLLITEKNVSGSRRGVWNVETESAMEDGTRSSAVRIAGTGTTIIYLRLAGGLKGG